MEIDIRRRLATIARSAVLAFVAMAAIGLSSGVRAGVPVTAEEVIVPTADGKAEATLLYPAAKGKYPAVILWPDFVGTRPAFRDLARRLAAEGFVVLVPNTFYRSMRPNDAELDPRAPDIRPTLMQYRAEATPEGIARDAEAYVAFLDRQKRANRGKIGAVGYDLGGAYAFRSAAALPGRIAAVASIYGAGVATANPDSPHLRVAESAAAYYIAIAADDDQREPGDKDDYRKVFGDAGIEGIVEIYEANHGWANPAAKAYDAGAADRSFGALVKLLKTKLG